LLLVGSCCGLAPTFDRLIVLMSCIFMLEMIVALCWLMMLNATSLDRHTPSLKIRHVCPCFFLVLAAVDSFPGSLTCHMPGVSKS